METKRFKLGFMVGRMQPIHKGHQQLIDFALELCDKFIILLGSSNESGTEANPLSFEERKSLIQKIYGNKIEVYPLVDIGIGYTNEWNNYLVNTVKFHCNGEVPDFYIGGVEEGRSECLSNYPNITTLYVSRDKIKVSGTQVREVSRRIHSISDDKALRASWNLLRDLVSNPVLDYIYSNAVKFAAR